MTPDAILPDGVDTVQIDGMTVRKGSVGAFLANWRAWCDHTAPAAERAAAQADLMALIPALSALGLFDVFEARDPVLRCWIEQHRIGGFSASPHAG